MRLRPVLFCLAFLFFTECGKGYEKMFTEDEKRQDLVIKEVYRDATVSSHIVLMNGRERPHFHDRHRFEVTLIKGKSRLHTAMGTTDLKPDLPVVVEKGTLHWAENTGHGYSLLSVLFFPPFDGKDRRFTGQGEK
jgi:mannose-6-phosphate isomerase-like protein (cupin superfamily)